MRLARNDWIFNNKTLNPEIMENKVKFLILESVGKKNLLSSLSSESSMWIGPHVIRNRRKKSKPASLPSWHLCVSALDFSILVPYMDDI